MRFSVFFPLLLATFVVSYDSFISAETYSLDDRTYDSTVVHRLRGNEDNKEERNGESSKTIAEQVASSTTKIMSPKTEQEAMAEEKKILQQKIVDLLHRSGRKHSVTKHKFPYKILALILLGAAVAGTTSFTIHHLMSASYDPKTAAAPPTTNTTTSGSA